MGPLQLESGDIFKSTEQGTLMQVVEVTAGATDEVRVRVRLQPYLGADALRTLPEDAEITLPARIPVFRRNRFAV